MDAITNALSLALAGQSPQAIATGAVSPYINNAIKQATENYPELNIPSHILWGAIEAEMTGGKATTGAIAAGVGELAAPILTEALYGKKSPSELTEVEKQHIVNLSKLAAGVASGLTAKGNTAENLVTVNQGMKIAENAVENNSVGQSYTAWEKEEKLRKEDPEAYQKLKDEQFELFKNALSVAIDFTPILGDIKSFSEAENNIDYLLSTVGLIPGAEAVTKPLKEVKASYQAAKNAEGLGNVANAKEHLDTANELLKQSLQGIYSSKEIRENFEKQYGKEFVKSTTVPPFNGKNVKLAGQKHPKTGVVFDNKGYAIFDKYTVFDTRLDIDNFRKLSYKEQMKMATRELSNKIRNGEIPSNKFSKEQLDAIYKGKEKIPNYTWHHHQDTGRMQLVNEKIHKETGHIGYEGMKNGK